MSDNGTLLDRWLNREDDTSGTSGIRRRDDDGPAQLSLGQQRLWFLQQLYPENPFYNYAESYRFLGKLDTAALLKCIEQVAGRHEILRSTFDSSDGVPLQTVHSTPVIESNEFDLTGVPEASRSAEAETLARKEARRPFYLEKLPLIRVSLIKLADDDHLVVVTMHHIVTDKWSMRVFRDDLAEFYKLEVSGSGEPPAPLPVQYADFADWERQKDGSPAEAEYWEDQLAGCEPNIALPADHRRPARPSFEGEYLENELSEELSKRIQKVSEKTGSTLFVVILSAFFLLLKRFSGQADLLVGTPYTNRDKVELEELIGFFNDTLVLRADVDSGLSFLEFVSQVRKTAIDAFSNRATPFEMLVKSIKPERYLNANPLFQVMFIFHDVPETPSFGEGLRFEHAPIDLGVSKFDLTLYVSEKNDRLSAIFEYSKDLFERETIRRMHRHLELLLEVVTNDPSIKLSALPAMPGDEKRRMIESWNDTAVSFPEKNSIHQLFEEQAEGHPENVAVAYDGRSLTYGELDNQANSIASFLDSLGLPENSTVGLFASPSLELISGLIGILKAGHSYLPLDPGYPAERLEYMISNSETRAVLAQEELVNDARIGDADIHSIEKAALTDPGVRNKVDSGAGRNAYVIYTSGSQGRPKGIPVTHANLLNSTFARSHFYESNPSSFLLMSSFAFDSSVVGIFWTLSTGGKLVLTRRRAEQDLGKLAKTMSDECVTHTLLLPTLYPLLIDKIKTQNVDSLETVILAGESCPGSLVRTHFEYLPDVALFNEYGPTEATVWSTVHRIKKNDEFGVVPIGRPIANTQIYILDSNMSPVPVGVQGEIFVGGANVVSGILGDEELTARRFVSNPFVEGTVKKLYRTGDIGRYRNDGEIEFLGRADDQIKIRGFRIELDEIAETIRKVTGLNDVAVTARKAREELDVIATLENMETRKADEILRGVEELRPEALDYLLNTAKT